MRKTQAPTPSSHNGHRGDHCLYCDLLRLIQSHYELIRELDDLRDEMSAEKAAIGKVGLKFVRKLENIVYRYEWHSWESNPLMPTHGQAEASDDAP